MPRGREAGREGLRGTWRHSEGKEAQEGTETRRLKGVPSEWALRARSRPRCWLSVVEGRSRWWPCLPATAEHR